LWERPGRRIARPDTVLSLSKVDAGLSRERYG
jgi:hypothetical protein